MMAIVSSSAVVVSGSHSQSQSNFESPRSGTPQNNNLLPVPSLASVARRGGPGGGGGGAGITTSASFRAHELMVMVEEGRVLRKVADTDLVDCERFASACRGVFSKRFGPKNPSSVSQSGNFSSADGVSKFDVFGAGSSSSAN